MSSHPAMSSAPAKVRRRNHSKSRAWRAGAWAVLGVGVALLAWGSRGQETVREQVVTTRQVKRPPLSHSYVHFLLYQNHLDTAAAAHDEQGKDGSWLRDHFQRLLGFTPSQFATVRATGLRLRSGLIEIGSEAKAIAQADRALHNKYPDSPMVPNPQLKDLTTQREELIQREIDTMNRDLGPEAAAKLQDFIENHFLQNANSLRFALPHPPAKRLQPSSAPQTVPQP